MAIGPSDKSDNASSFVQTDDERRIAAYHEAGHAVVSFLCGCPISYVRVTEDPFSNRTGNTTPSSIASSYYRLLICASGRAEEILYEVDRNEGVPRGDGMDVYEANGIVYELLRDIGRVDKYEQLAKECYQKLVDDAVQQLAPDCSRSAVELLAQELYLSHTLSGERTSDLICSAMKIEIIKYPVMRVPDWYCRFFEVSASQVDLECADEFFKIWNVPDTEW